MLELAPETQKSGLCGWFLSFSILFSRFILVISWIWFYCMAAYITLHLVSMLHFTYPFIIWWIFGLLSFLDCYEKCCYERSCTRCGWTYSLLGFFNLHEWVRLVYNFLFMSVLFVLVSSYFSFINILLLILDTLI